MLLYRQLLGKSTFIIIYSKKYRTVYDNMIKDQLTILKNHAAVTKSQLNDSVLKLSVSCTNKAFRKVMQFVSVRIEFSYEFLLY